MKHSKFLIIPAILALTGCSFDFSIHFPEISIGGSSYSYSAGSAAQYSQEGAVSKIEVKDKLSMRQIAANTGMDYLPNEGEVNLLVLPIELQGYPFSSYFRTDLDHALNGTAEDTGYWESLSSFYEKTSFGKVHLHFEIADTYVSELSPRSALTSSKTGEGADNGGYFVESALDAYHAKHDTSKFDSDNNGWIDGIVAVYSCPDFQNMSSDFDEYGYFWAYTYWLVDDPVVGAPTGNLYFWLSYDFIYEAVRTPRVDAHTLIHETGHMFGLDDYYPSEGSKFDPVGGLDMMSHNILDHDCYSKMALGWVDPYVVTGEAEITLNPSNVNGDCILVPGLDKDGNVVYNGSAFDEYMLVELYTPDGLNAMDARNRYPGRTLGYTQPGVKIFHVDARVMRFNADRSGRKINQTYVENIAEIPSDRRNYYEVGATNCSKEVACADSSFSLIHLMEAGGRNTFASGGLADNGTLFKKGDSFSLAYYGMNFFPKKSTFNSGANFPYTITVKELSATSATISITKA